MSNIHIEVETGYLPEQSQPEQNRFAFRYTVTIHNQGSESAQLLSRYWRITDAEDQVREVRGAGVVGEQPTIEPGSFYRYTSGAVLHTFAGTMEGSYQMRTADGTEYETTIPTFALVEPNALH
ncbi:Co2+/Mg2+ efflux protein ApaG [Gilvimarinus agarilyticus]|uniref:Co2+/Mg2+ efflux protein ApaG n=1 Tax=unclassified Gilvimarinus TaxID=2642066 RepID=UPI001C091C29|nr:MULTISPECIES: Co2+/Mg2+ efflux protein ApaG [unclassified Gilvimarinus]MBU2887596.1 Co2+/Mg2+ efflux protein ApaG [Gilvimarinus agarilyticus]MDO6572247.1 Co2+/Mg2+ efflux protein ApaG [Gilvimarinus sp. 2_MG-2023]MDO6746814.1 Co2+/Mg2+ efflux protein ApaG [Gilvimarinus sp. 1_MG-2023]